MRFRWCSPATDTRLEEQKPSTRQDGSAFEVRFGLGLRTSRSLPWPLPPPEVHINSALIMNVIQVTRPSPHSSEFTSGPYVGLIGLLDSRLLLLIEPLSVILGPACSVRRRPMRDGCLLFEQRNTGIPHNVQRRECIEIALCKSVITKAAEASRKSYQHAARVCLYVHGHIVSIQEQHCLTNRKSCRQSPIINKYVSTKSLIRTFYLIKAPYGSTLRMAHPLRSSWHIGLQHVQDICP